MTPSYFTSGLRQGFINLWAVISLLKNSQYFSKNIERNLKTKETKLHSNQKKWENNKAYIQINLQFTPHLQAPSAFQMQIPFITCQNLGIYCEYTSKEGSQ